MQTNADDPRISEAKRDVPLTLLALMIFAQFPSALTQTVTAPLLAGMAKDLVHPGDSLYLVKLITGIIGPGLIIGAPLAGWLADRYDRRPLIAAFGALFILSAAAPAFLDSLGAIVASRFIAGACGGALSTIGMAMVGYYYDDRRRPGIIGLLAFLTLATSIATLPVAGALASSNWRHAFYIFLAMIPLVALALLRPLPAPARLSINTTAAPQAGDRFPRIPAALMVIACVNGLALTLPGILYSFYFTELGVTHVATISLFLMYQAVIGGALTLLYGRAAQRMTAKSIFLVCLTCTALGLGIQGLTSDYRIAAVSLTFTGIAMGWFVPNISASAILLVDRRHHGAAIGIIRALSSLAALVGIIDPLQRALGTRGIFLSVAGIAALVLMGLVTGALPLRRAEVPD